MTKKLLVSVLFVLPVTMYVKLITLSKILIENVVVAHLVMFLTSLWHLKFNYCVHMNLPLDPFRVKLIHSTPSCPSPEDASQFYRPNSI